MNWMLKGIEISAALGKRKMSQSAFKLQKIPSFVPGSAQNTLPMKNILSLQNQHTSTSVHSYF